MCGLGCSSTGDRETTGGDLVTSRFAGAVEVIGVILLVVIDAVVRPTAGIGVKILEDAGMKLKTVVMIRCFIYVVVCICSVLCWLKFS